MHHHGIHEDPSGSPVFSDPNDGAMEEPRFHDDEGLLRRRRSDSSSRIDEIAGEVASTIQSEFGSLAQRLNGLSNSLGSTISTLSQLVQTASEGIADEETREDTKSLVNQANRLTKRLKADLKKLATDVEGYGEEFQDTIIDRARGAESAVSNLGNLGRQTVDSLRQEGERQAGNLAENFETYRGKVNNYAGQIGDTASNLDTKQAIDRIG
eukprot:717655_1